MSHGLAEQDRVALNDEVEQLLKIAQWHQDRALDGAGWTATHAADTAAQLANTAVVLAEQHPVAVLGVLDEIHAGLLLLLKPEPHQTTVFAAQRHQDRARTRARLAALR